MQASSPSLEAATATKTPSRTALETALSSVVEGEPSLEAAQRSDPKGLRLMLEVALLARARVCLQASHLGRAFVTKVRVSMGKRACIAPALIQA